MNIHIDWGLVLTIALGIILARVVSELVAKVGKLFG